MTPMTTKCLTYLTYCAPNPASFKMKTNLFDLIHELCFIPSFNFYARQSALKIKTNDNEIVMNAESIHFMLVSTRKGPIMIVRCSDLKYLVHTLCWHYHYCLPMASVRTTLLLDENVIQYRALLSAAVIAIECIAYLCSPSTDLNISNNTGSGSPL